MPAWNPRANEIFIRALELGDLHQRNQLLTELCGDDLALCQAVERLLAANEAAGSFLEKPALAIQPERTGTFAPGSEDAGPQTIDAVPETVDRPGRDEQVGAIIAGKYMLIEAIGEGGMGQVFMAQQTEPVKRAVAVKVIKAGMDSKAVLARFEAERQALAMMDHPNIARVLDAGATESGRPFFVMELVKGVPITQFCDERKLTPKQRLELFVPVCQAIQHAHQKGIIHRDIKPSNVLVALYDDRAVPKVIDFGVAKATGQTLTDMTLMTGFGAVVGTPEYMSPEQASLNNMDVDTRSDVYSLGVLLYELLTGSTPMDRKSLGKAALLEILRIVRELEVPRPSHKLSTADALPSISANRGTEPAKLSKLMKGELDWLVLKALEKDRTRRYETANGFARDIQRYLDDEIVEARPPSTGYRLKKFVRRHKGQVIAASLVMFVLLGGIVGTTWQAIRAEIARERAETAEHLASQERDRATAERDEKEAARAKELEARRVAQDRLVRSHVRSGATATERDEGFNALHWYNAAWQADAENPERDSIHRLRIGSALRQLPELQAVRIHSDNLKECTISPDGQKVLSYSDQSYSVEVWSPITGRLLVAPLPHPKFVLSAEWTANGKYLFTWANDHALLVWDAATGKLVGAPLHSQVGVSLSAVGLSPDGRTGLLAAKEESMIEAVEVQTGKNLRTWKTDGDAISLRYSPTGNRFASAVADKAILFDPNAPEPIATVSHWTGKLPDYHDSPTSNKENPSAARLPAFTADGRRFITLVPNGHGFAVWDTESGKMIATQNQIHQSYGLTISPSGRLVMTYGNSVSGKWLYYVCEVATGRVVTQANGRRTVNNGTIFPDEKSVLYATSGGDVARADITSDGQPYGPVLRTSGAGLLSPQISPDGRTVLIANSDGIAKVWKLPSTNKWSSYDIALGGPTNGRIATRDGRVRVEQLNGIVEVRKGSGEPKVLENAPKDEYCWLSPDGLHAVFADGKKAYRVWDTSTGKPVTDWFAGTGEQSDYPQAFFTPDNKYLYTFGAKGVFECRAVSTGNPVPDRNIKFISTFARCTKISPDGKWLAVGYHGADAFVYSIDETKSKPLTLKNTFNVWSVDFSADSRYVATEGGDLTARVWEVASGKPAGPTIRSPFALRQIVFSPDGKSVLTLDHNGYSRLWDWKTADLITTFPRIATNDDHRAWFSPDGRFAAVHPGSPAAKPICYPIDRFAFARVEFPNFLTLLTAQRMDETEAIVPLRKADIVKGKKSSWQVWLKLHPELAVADPMEPARNDKLVTANANDLPKDWLTPEQAAKRVGETVVLKMTVRSVGRSKSGKTIFFNTHADLNDPDNIRAAVLNPTPERLRDLALPDDHQMLVDRTIILRGKMELIQDKLQIKVSEGERFWILEQDPAEKD
jgi:eukaryotic-like serine/threonine-protein kinase